MNYHSLLTERDDDGNLVNHLASEVEEKETLTMSELIARLGGKG